jgi:hypothetical protein
MDNAEWQSRVRGILTDQLGIYPAWAADIVERYVGHEMLAPAEAELMGKVLGIIGGMIGGYFVVSSLASNPSAMIQAQSAGIAGMVKAIQATDPRSCDTQYPLSKGREAKEGCYLRIRHAGLHVLANGFAFDDEDIEWANRQLRIINA